MYNQCDSISLFLISLQELSGMNDIVVILPDELIEILNSSK
jgi:hypothetical protein